MHVLYAIVTRSARGVEKGPSVGRQMLTASSGTRTVQAVCEVSLPHCVAAAGLLGTLGMVMRSSTMPLVNFLK